MSVRNRKPAGDPPAGTAAAETQPAKGRKARRERDDRGFIGEWTVTLLMLLFGWTAILQAYVIPTGSMEDNLLIGDHLLVDKLSYAPPGSFSRHFLPYTEVRRGDIIVFRYPLNLRENYVKRVIGIPGDRLRIENKQVHLNGKPINEPYKYHKTDYIDSYRDNFPSQPNLPLPPEALEMLETSVKDGELVIPPGKYFAMGDNRDNSADSRYWGFVSRDHIVGKPWVIYWSYDAPTDRLVSSFSFEHLADLAMNFFTKTRWERTLQTIKGYPLEAPAN
jgi:signal peptidase I